MNQENSTSGEDDEDEYDLGGMVRMGEVYKSSKYCSQPAQNSIMVKSKRDEAMRIKEGRVSTVGTSTIDENS